MEGSNPVEVPKYFFGLICDCSLHLPTRVIRLRVIEGPNARDQIALCAFHSFLVEVQTNAGNIYATHA